MQSQVKAVVRLFQVTDALVIAATVAFTSPPLPPTTFELFLLLLLVPCWASLFRYFRLYESHRLQGVGGAIRAVISAQIIGTLALGLAFATWHVPDRAAWLVKFGLLSTTLLIFQRWVTYLVLHLLRRRGFDERQVLFVGARENADEIIGSFEQHPEWGLRVAAIGVGAPGERQYWTQPDCRPYGASLEDLLRAEVIDEFLIHVPAEQLPAEQSFLHACHEYGLLGRVLLDLPAAPITNQQIEDFCGSMSIAVGAERQDSPRLWLKRITDVVFSAILLLLLAPVLLLIAMLVKLSSPGPILFRQRRMGLHGRSFNMLKFRTMIDGAESLQKSLVSQTITGGPIYKNPVDWRVTPVGRILRRFSLDELPQLLNVLSGEMSLVGPRPLPLQEAAAISGSHRRRFSMRPGITCLWQVNGRSTVKYSTWMEYDLQYVDGWSFWLDLKLLARTIPAVLGGRGAY
jgi:exopolysaccharide biosynthesis polyprenyl glycosylphosphotransferase